MLLFRSSTTRQVAKLVESEPMLITKMELNRLGSEILLWKLLTKARISTVSQVSQHMSVRSASSRLNPVAKYREDQTFLSGINRVKFHKGEEAIELLKHRCQIIKLVSSSLNGQSAISHQVL